MTLEWRLVAEGLRLWDAYDGDILVGRVSRWGDESSWLAEWTNEDGYIDSQGGFATADEAKAAVEAKVAVL